MNAALLLNMIADSSMEVIVPKKQADGRYRSKITVGYDTDGKAVVKYASGRTKRELEANTAELKKRFITGALEVEREILFEVYAENWVNTYKKGRKSAGTDENYHSALYVHLIPEFRGRQLRAISSFDLQNLMNSKAGLGKTTIGYIYTVIRNVFNKAAAEGVIDRNPVMGLTKPECDAKERRALTDTEIAATLKVGGEHSDGLLLLLLYYTGLRRGEAIGLQWHDIDFQKNTLTVRRDFDFKTMELGKPKTKAALRTLPIPSELLAELDRVRGIGETFIFHSIIHSTGNKLQAYRNTWEDLRKALYNADKKIEARGAKSILTAHYYRHNYASILYNGGVDVLTAQKWLGHADAKTTLSIYSHLSKEYELQNAEKLNAVFSKAAKKLPESK